jgi:hypothetical protein
MQGEPVEKLTAEVLDRLSFAKAAHTWLTFISGLVFDRGALHEALQGDTIDRFTGTSLVQLGWALPLLRLERGLFVLVPERCILATKDNTGGYPLLTVFATRFTQIVKAVFGDDSPVSRALVRGNVLHYLPLLIWPIRTSAMAGHHLAEDPWPSMRLALGDRTLFWMLIVPLGRFPRWFALPLFQGWRVFFRISRQFRRLRGPNAVAPKHF